MSASKKSSAMSKKTTTTVSLSMSFRKGQSAHPAAQSAANAGQNVGPKVMWQSQEDLFYTSRVQIAEFFRNHRLLSNLSLEQVRQSLSLDSIEIVSAYENGERSIPLEDLFSLTNLLNIPPEEVLALVFDSTSQQGLR